jgi:hypothetical protein
VEGGDHKTVAEEEDEALPQLTVHTLEEVSAKTFVRKLAKGKNFQNWKIQEAPVVFKMYTNFVCLNMLLSLLLFASFITSG